MQQFSNDQSGAISIFSLFILTALLMVAGLAIDVAHLYMSRTRLQVAADTAAHAALYNREVRTEVEAKAQALAIVSNTMPSGVFGAVLTADDIEFGNWDDTTKTFTPAAGSKQAVRVQTRQIADRNNAVDNFLLKLVGAWDFNVNTPAVFATTRPGCLSEGFVAENTVDMQSNNYFYSGFCIHSNNHVEVNQNNIFETGVHISMPDIDDFSLPGRTPVNFYEGNNSGVNQALGEGRYDIRILRKVPDIITELADVQGDFLPDYITNTLPKSLDGSGLGIQAGIMDGKAFVKSMPFAKSNKSNGNGNSGGNGSGNGSGANSLTPASFTPNSVHTFRCSGNSDLTIDSGTYREFVLVTNCAITFAKDVILEDVVVATTDTSDKSIETPSGFQLGRDDNCAAGGGAQLITMGSFFAAAKMVVHGGQIIALKDIDFAAQGVGGGGASFVAGGMIDARSNNQMGFCNGSGMEDNFEADYFRLTM